MTARCLSVEPIEWPCRPTSRAHDEAPVPSPAQRPLNRRHVKRRRPTRLAAALGLIVVAGVLSGCGGSADHSFSDGTTLATPRALVGGLATTAPTEPPEDDPEPTDPPELRIKVTKLTKSVRAGGNATIAIKTAKRARCDISVEYNSGTSTARGLKPKRASSTGVVKWTWVVGSRTAAGTYPISIWCEAGSRFGSIEREFRVRH